LEARIGLVALPSAFFPCLLAILAAYCMLTQVAKSWYLRRFSSWL
jgi:Mg2+-importing ATPase